MKRRAQVAVLMGGWSAEREVSLNSGKACAEALESAGYAVTPVDVDRAIADTLTKLRPGVALNMLHGPFGEDGCMQGLLEILGIPYSHSGVLASALAMNKVRARDVLERNGIAIAEGRTISRFTAAEAHAMEPPYVIKPIANGSSVGVYIVDAAAKMPPKEIAASDWEYGEMVLIEKYVGGRELTCAVMNDTALDVIEIQFELPFYNYKVKYASGGSRHILPAEIPDDTYKKVQAMALGAHHALGCRGITRSDFRFDDKTGELVCLEVNTQPGMTRTSLVPELAAYAGLSFPELVDWMVKDASINR